MDTFFKWICFFYLHCRKSVMECRTVNLYCHCQTFGCLILRVWQSRSLVMMFVSTAVVMFYLIIIAWLKWCFGLGNHTGWGIQVTSFLKSVNVPEVLLRNNRTVLHHETLSNGLYASMSSLMQHNENCSVILITFSNKVFFSSVLNLMS